MAYQHLDFLRAFLNNRLAWSRLGFMLCSPGGFQIWRRDVLEEVGGYSREFTCEDIELTFRVHERFLREGRDYEIHCLPDNVGITEGPDTVRKLVSQRERWQRVINETVWHYRQHVVQPALRQRRADRRAVLPPDRGARSGRSSCSRSWRSCVAVALGLFDPVVFVVDALRDRVHNAALTACAILLDDLQSRTYRVRDLVAPARCSRRSISSSTGPIIVWARLKGSWRFLRGDKAWHKFERNARAPA